MIRLRCNLRLPGDHMTVKQMFDKKKEATVNNENARRSYVERVRRALVTSPDEMSRGAYIEALEQIDAEIDSMLEVARQEEREETE